MGRFSLLLHRLHCRLHDYTSVADKSFGKLISGLKESTENKSALRREAKGREEGAKRSYRLARIFSRPAR